MSLNTNFLYLSTINYDLFNPNLLSSSAENVDSLPPEADITDLFPDTADADLLANATLANLELSSTTPSLSSPISVTSANPELSSITPTLSSSTSVTSVESINSPRSIASSSESVSSFGSSTHTQTTKKKITSSQTRKERNRISAQNYRNKKRAFEEDLLAKSAILDHIVAMVNCQVEPSKAIALTTIEGSSLTKAQIIMKLFKESLKK